MVRNDKGIKVDKIVMDAVAIIVLIFVIYLIYWLAKNGSYFFWYESMVKDTIREMVQQQYLK